MPSIGWNRSGYLVGTVSTGKMKKKATSPNERLEEYAHFNEGKTGEIGNKVKEGRWKYIPEMDRLSIFPPLLRPMIEWPERRNRSFVGDGGSNKMPWKSEGKGGGLGKARRTGRRSAQTLSKVDRNA